MNLDKLKTPALFFFAGYGFFMLDHWHKSIMNHTYHIALLAFGMFVVYQLLQRKSTTQAETAQPPLIQQDPAQTSHTLDIKQPNHVSVS